jgi:hypothetical protein
LGLSFFFCSKDESDAIEMDEFVQVFLEVNRKQKMVDWIHNFVDSCAGMGHTIEISICSSHFLESDALLAYDTAIESLFRELDDEQVGSVDWEGFWIVLQVFFSSSI